MCSPSNVPPPGRGAPGQPPRHWSWRGAFDLAKSVRSDERGRAHRVATDTCPHSAHVTRKSVGRRSRSDARRLADLRDKYRARGSIQVPRSGNLRRQSSTRAPGRQTKYRDPTTRRGRGNLCLPRGYHRPQGFFMDVRLVHRHFGPGNSTRVADFLPLRHMLNDRGDGPFSIGLAEGLYDYSQTAVVRSSG